MRNILQRPKYCWIGSIGKERHLNVVVNQLIQGEKHLDVNNIFNERDKGLYENSKGILVDFLYIPLSQEKRSNIYLGSYASYQDKYIDFGLEYYIGNLRINFPFMENFEDHISIPYMFRFVFSSNSYTRGKSVHFITV